MKKVIALSFDYLSMPSPLSLGTQGSGFSDSDFELSSKLHSCRKQGGEGYSIFSNIFNRTTLDSYFQSALSPGKEQHQGYKSVLELLEELEKSPPPPPPLELRQGADSFGRTYDDGIDRGSPPLI